MNIELSHPENIYPIDVVPDYFEAIVTMSSTSAMEGFFNKSDTKMDVAALTQMKNSITKIISTVQDWKHEQSEAVKKYTNSMFVSNRDRIKELTKSIKTLSKTAKEAKRIMNAKGIPEETRAQQKALYDATVAILNKQLDESEALHKNIFITPEHAALLANANAAARAVYKSIDDIFKKYRGTVSAITNPRDKRFPISTDEFIREMQALATSTKFGNKSLDFQRLQDSLNDAVDKIYQTTFKIDEKQLVRYPLQNILEIQKGLKGIDEFCAYIVDRMKSVRDHIEQQIAADSINAKKHTDAVGTEVTFIISIVQIYTNYYAAYLNAHLSIPQAVNAIREATSKL